jgi:hypothetical protein
VGESLTPDQAVAEAIEALMKRRHGASGTPIYVDEVLLRDILAQLVRDLSQ